MKVADIAKNRVISLMQDGTVNRVFGWKRGELAGDRTPAIFTSAEDLNEFVYDEFCSPNLSKFLIEETKKDGKILAFLKPCDTYSFNQLVKEYRIKRDNVYIVGIECGGMLDMGKIKDGGAVGVTNVDVNESQVSAHTLYGDKMFEKEDVLLEKCLSCKGKKHMVADEIIGSEEGETRDRFKCVEEIEAMTPAERFKFWQGQLSKCIRCNACRNVCPACSCLECVFDNPKSGVASKAGPDDFEDQMYHIIRAYHVAGRCTDCGECSRVCPQHIPLHLLNRKLIKDMNELYGEYTAGADDTTIPPLVSYTKEDAEPNTVSDRGGDR